MTIPVKGASLDYLLKYNQVDKLIRNKNIECKFGCMFFNNIRIVENKLNFYNIMVLTNENKLRVVMLKMKLF